MSRKSAMVSKFQRKGAPGFLSKFALTDAMDSQYVDNIAFWCRKPVVYPARTRPQPRGKSSKIGDRRGEAREVVVESCRAQRNATLRSPATAACSDAATGPMSGDEIGRADPDARPRAGSAIGRARNNRPAAPIPLPSLGAVPHDQGASVVPVGAGVDQSRSPRKRKVPVSQCQSSAKNKLATVSPAGPVSRTKTFAPCAEGRVACPF